MQSFLRFDLDAGYAAGESKRMSATCHTSQSLGTVAVMILVLFLSAACATDGDPFGDEGTTERALAESPGDGTTDDTGNEVVEFSTWAEDAFEEAAYLTIVDVFTTDTGVDVQLDLTVNEVSLEELGQ